MAPGALLLLILLLFLLLWPRHAGLIQIGSNTLSFPLSLPGLDVQRLEMAGASAQVTLRSDVRPHGRTLHARTNIKMILPVAQGGAAVAAVFESAQQPTAASHASC